MPTFTAKAKQDEVLRDQHNVLVDQLNKWEATTTDFVRSTTLTYTEGAWSPTARGSAAAGTVTLSGTGTYTRIGRECTVHYWGSFTANTGSSGTMWISNFPYNSHASIPQTIPVNYQGVGWTAGRETILYLPGSSNISICYETVANGNFSPLGVALFSTSDTISINGTYVIAT